MEELYNQLYLAMQKQGNRAQEIIYHAEYLEWHRKKLSKHPGRNLGSLASLCFHKYSTMHGKSWLLGVAWLIGLGATLYFCCAISLDEIHLGFTYLSWDNFCFHTRYFFEFLVPTHKIDFMSAKPGDGAVIVDFINRLVVGLLLYQIIAAFRRFGKK